MSEAEVTVSNFTVGELVPFKGIYWKVTDVFGGGEDTPATLSLEAVGVTKSWMKANVRKVRNGPRHHH